MHRRQAWVVGSFSSCLFRTAECSTSQTDEGADVEEIMSLGGSWPDERKPVAMTRDANVGAGVVRLSVNGESAR